MASTTISPNLAAFLTVLRKAEGTDTANGYRYLFGSTPNNEKLFNSFSDHPRQKFAYTDLSGKKITTTAAGAYQILASTWDRIKDKIGLTDFSPASQDKAAIELIREKNALQDIEKGDIPTAVYKLRKVWASLPGSDVNQPTRTMVKIQAWFNDAKFWFMEQPTATKVTVSGVGVILISGMVYSLYRFFGKS